MKHLGEVNVLRDENEMTSPIDSHRRTAEANELPLQARVAAARALLESSSAEGYDDLPASQRAHFQEAIEHLRRVEGGITPGER